MSNDIKKILRIDDVLPPEPGGKSIHKYNLTIEQVKLNYIVVNYFSQGKKIFPTDVQFLSFFYIHRIQPAFFVYFLFYLLIIFRLIIKPQRFDIVHIHGDWSSFIFGPIIKRLVRANSLVFSNHGYVIKKLYYKILTKNILRFSDVVYFSGYEPYQIYSEYCKKSFFRPSGIRHQFFEKPRLSSDTNVPFSIISVGNVWPPKNYLLLMQIAKLLPEISFKIIGDYNSKYLQLSGEYAKLIQYCIDSNIKNVEFKGKLELDELIEELDKSDIYLLTSNNEGTPTALMEAMSRGLPIISTAVGGIQSIVNDEINGYVISDLNPASFSAKINFLFDNMDLMNQIKENNIKKAQDFRWDKVAKLITENYF